MAGAAVKSMAQTRRRAWWPASCLAAMVLVAAIAFQLGASWLLLAAIAIALACLSAIVYAWLAARRIDQYMESGGKNGPDTTK